MGRLIDANRLKEVFSRNVAGGNAYFDLIDNAPTVEAILKADMVDMLTEIQLEIEEKGMELCDNGWYLTYSDIVQQKIDALKEGNKKNDNNEFE